MKRNFAASALCILLALGLPGCVSNGNVGIYKPGRYTATAQGRGGKVTVTVTTDKDKIVDIKVVGDKETVGIGTEVINDLPKKIIAANSADVDAVSGATMTSEAVKEAVKNALAQAAGKSLVLPELKMKAGTYTGKAKGMDGTIVVQAEVSEDKILSVKVIDNVPKNNPIIGMLPVNWLTALSINIQKDLPAFLESAAGRLPDRIVKSQSLAVDVVTGATGSSRGIINAVADCVAQAGGNPAALNRPVLKSTKSEEYTCDVVVVGAGTAGSTAAAKAAASGAKVILIEKSGRVGGTGAISYMPMTTGSRMHDAAGIKNNVEALQELIMKQVHYVANGAMINDFLRESPDTMNFLMDHGFKFLLPRLDQGFLMAFGEAKMKEDPNTYAMLTYQADPLTKEINDYFVELTSKVDTLMYETTGKSLLTDAAGNVVGLKAERQDGTQITIKSKAVIVATGGFAGSEELQKKYNKFYYRPLGLMQNVGEGLRMMLAVGAAEKNIGGYVAHVYSTYAPIEDEAVAPIDRNIPYTLSCSPTLLRVTPRGSRFMNENQASINLQPALNGEYAAGPYFYTIISGKQYKAIKEKGLAGTGMDTYPRGQSIKEVGLPHDFKMVNLDAVVAAAEKVGTMFKGNTIAELAQAAGMQPEVLQKTIGQYDKLCVAKKDTVFFKDAKYLDPLGTEGPYYAVKSLPEVYSSLGGVDVDENMQVLRFDGRKIDGLYAAGVDSIGAVTDGVMYPEVEGLTLGWGFTSGKVAGRSAAEFAKK